MKDSRTRAALFTAAFAALVVVVLLVGRLNVDPAGWPPKPRTTELVEVDEEFVEFFEAEPRHSDPAPPYSATEQKMQSEPGVADGADLADAGEAAAPAPDVTTERPAPVAKPKKEKPERTGPDKKAAEAEKARRQARQGVADAFRTSSETPDNTASKGSAKGDTGRPDGSVSDLSASGQGSVGGGWIMPRYAKVSTHHTGSIELRAVVDSSGRVTSVELTGGKAPASGDPALVARCIAEVRRHRFTRNDDDAPERSIARIIYNFK